MHPPRAASARPTEIPTACDWLSLRTTRTDEESSSGRDQSRTTATMASVAGQDPQSRPKNSAVDATITALWVDRH